MYIRVRVTPKARRESLIEEKDGYFKVSVKEPSEDNRANKRVVELLAEYFKLPSSRLRILKGQHMPSKILEIIGPP